MNPLTLGAKGPTFQFRLRGLPVRVYAHFFVLAALLGTLADGLVGTAVGSVVAFLVVLAHELGHAAAEQVFGLRPAIDLVWFGGATSDEGVHGLSRLRRIAVFVAGPLAGALVGGLAWQLGGDRSGIAGGAAEVGLQVGVVWGLANLLPIWPMDGGHLLVDLLPGRRDTRRRIAHVVSLALAALASLVALVVFDVPLFAMFAGGIAYLNLHVLRTSGSVERAAQALRDALSHLSAGSAADGERTAREVLADSPPAAVATAAADLLLASHLVRGDSRRAGADLADLTTTWVWPLLRDLVVLGDAAGPELERRLAAEPSDHDVRLAALYRSLHGDHDGVAALAASPLAPALDWYTAHVVQTRAFYARAFRASNAIGDAAVALPDVPPHVTYNVACGWAQLGETEAALAALERAAEAGWADVDAMDADEDLAALHGLPAYRDIRRRVASGQGRRPRHEDGYRRSGAMLGLASCLTVTGLVAVLPGGDRPSESGSEVLALDAVTGAVRWQIDMDGAYAGIAASGDLLMVNRLAPTRRPGGATVTLRDPLDGRTMTSIGGVGTGAARTRDGGVLAGYYDRDAHAVRATDATTGRERWTLETAFGSPRVLGDVAVLSSLDDIGLQAIDVGSGRVLWTRDDVQSLWDSSDVVLAESANGHRIMSIDPRTGEERWAAIIDGNSRLLGSHIWVDESAHERALIDVYTGARTTVPVADVAAEPLLELDTERAVLSTGNAISVVDLVSGKERWRRPTSARQAVTVDGALVTTSRQGVTAFDVDTGEPLWTMPPERVPRLSTVANTVLVSSAEGLQAVDARRGTVLWTWGNGAVPTASAVFGDLVVVTRNAGPAQGAQ